MKKKLYDVFAILFAGLLAFSFFSCSDDSSDENGSGDAAPTAISILPAPVGDNVFAGKSISGNSIFGYATMKFDNTTAELSISGKKEEYAYSYNTETSLLYCALKKVTIDTGSAKETYTNASEFAVLAKKYGGMSEAELEKRTAEIAAGFSILQIYQYTISGSNITLTGAYFDGKLPTISTFESSWDSETRMSFSLNDGEIEFRVSDEKYSCAPIFKDGKFSGTIFKKEKTAEKSSTYKSLGKLAGTYTTEGTGISGCKVTITFTELPSEIESLKDKEFVLEQK